MTTLTQCQQQVLDMLISYQKERGFPPTNQEVATMLGCMARLKKNNSDLHDLLVDYYVGGMTFMALARKHGRSDCWVGRLLQKAEGIIEGMLIMLEIELEMDSNI
ncbi:antiterminator Q family protein [Escherichia coli]|uniref:antiterminator Q family protein n=1 Tax=Escherichia coli TaxID=562 RepID=UPI000BE551F5|nr:antiterminator Q family protein [Escherichia coli]